MKNFIIVLLIACSPLVSYSHQNNAVLITGKVIDAITDEPLPFANVIYDQTGTSTNPEGEFVLLVEDASVSEQLLVKFIGYESQNIELGKKYKNLTIKLNRSTQYLENIDVYSAEEILKDVYNHRHINYEFDDQMLSAYYKESVNSPANCMYLAEGIFDIFLPSIYSRSATQIEAKKTRKKEFVSLDTLGLPMFNGHASDMIQDATRREDSFLDRREMPNYIFSKEDITEYDGKEVFKIKFEPRNRKGTAKGVLYVDMESKAVIKAEYYPILENQYFWTNVMWTEEYIEADGRWYIHRVSYTGAWDHFGETYTYNALMVVSDFQETTGMPEMLNPMDNQAVFFSEADSFAENFWEDYNYIKLTPNEKKSFAQR